MKKVVLILSVIGMSFWASNSTAQAVVAVKPKPAKVVVVKPTKVRRGHTWIAGHWTWNTRRNSYIWVDGYWTTDGRGRPLWVDGYWQLSRPAPVTVVRRARPRVRTVKVVRPVVVYR